MVGSREWRGVATNLRMTQILVEQHPSGMVRVCTAPPSKNLSDPVYRFAISCEAAQPTAIAEHTMVPSLVLSTMTTCPLPNRLIDDTSDTNRGRNVSEAGDNCRSSALPQRSPEAEPINRRESMVYTTVSDVLQQLRLYHQRGTLLQHWAGHEHI
jgi:hypothetical protein